MLFLLFQLFLLFLLFLLLRLQQIFLWKALLVLRVLHVPLEALCVMELWANNTILLMMKIFKCLHRKGNRILVYDALDGLWVAQGLYDMAVEINDSVLFDNSDGKATLHLLVSSFKPGISFSSIAPSCARSLQGGSLPSTSHSATPKSSVHSHSCSNSMSTSGGIQTGSIEPSDVDAATTQDVEDLGTSFTPYESTLLQLLNIPMNQFLCYLAVTNALNDMRKVKQWPEKPPSERQVTELFIRKSQWSNVWHPTFSRVSQHFPEMVKLLQGDADSKTAEELWGVEAKYTLKMLKEWMDRGGKPLKGKSRAVEEPVAERSLKGLEKDKEKKKKKKKSDKSDE
ncbi:hypothetical protein K443DRAFT_125432 [Laccaria amethystina LaAM-08-1]|uniref:Uncharacterized protein n=1 Tax=Laccaria amethystina LaAM-08-1 TaxID=1095629 RepID=A0A0C9WJ20_9AGAR|nr:hypothetical protein K443DRAFT_125432 [Laccaria amethystina LaAM-08-1]